MRSRLVSVLLLAATCRVAAAQRVRVTVSSEETGTPIRGAVVSLLSPTNATVGEGLTDTTGSRLLTAPAPGSYRVRVRRIGFEPFLSDTVRLATGVIQPLVLRVPNSRVTLEAVRVVAQRPDCRVGASVSSLEAASVWDQIKTALVTSELSRRDSVVRTSVRTFVRDVSPTGRVLEAHSAERGEAGAKPFDAADPGMLLQVGYVQMQPDLAATYWAPDARVLTSDEFARTHCFGLMEGSGGDSALVGLTFEPTLDRTVPDIAGTLWVDREHVALQRVDFRYVRVQFPIHVADVGGVVEFASLPSGGWFPSFWRIRMPRFREIITSGISEYVLAGYTETGGIAAPAEEIGRLLIASGRPELTEVTRTATVIVRVMDGGSLEPLRGANVELTGAVGHARSDSTGRAVFTHVARGPQHLLERHVGFVPIDTTIDIGGDTLSVELQVDRSVALLDTIKVHAEPLTLRMQAFETRRAMGIGRFLTDSALGRERERPLPFVLVNRFPGLRLVQVPPPPKDVSDPCKGNWCAFADQIPGTMHLEAMGQSGILHDTSPTCPVDVYVDGFFYTEDMEALPTDRILAVELYDKQTAPPEYRRAGKACKVLLLWTKNR